jgi:hypothetical protein
MLTSEDKENFEAESGWESNDEERQQVALGAQVTGRSVPYVTL